MEPEAGSHNVGTDRYSLRHYIGSEVWRGMDFFGIGGWEILLILIIALIIWGPRRIAEIGRTLGKTVRALKKATLDLTAQVTKEIDDQERDQPPRQHKCP